LAHFSFASMIYFTLKMFRKQSNDSQAIWECFVQLFHEKSNLSNKLGTKKIEENKDKEELIDEGFLILF
jgi:hypothetical protein